MRSRSSGRRGRATPLYNVVSQIGASGGVAFLTTVLASRMAAHHALPGNPLTAAGAWAAFHETFAAAILAAILGMGAAFLVSDRLASASIKRPGAAVAIAPRKEAGTPA